MKAPVLAFFLCAAAVVFSGCDQASTVFVLDRAGRHRMEKEERLAREESARLAREKAERLEHEQGEAEKLRATLPDLAKARVKLFKTKADELTEALKGIAEDRRLAEKAMASVEDRRGLEYTVYNVMTNEALNALAVKYTGGDFSALRSEFTEAVRFHKTSQAALAQSLQKNAEEYRRQVKGVDDGVDAANQNAQTAVNAAHANIMQRIAKIERERKEFLAVRKVREDDPRLKTLDATLERLEQLLELSGGSTAHIKATVLESSARRKFDRALDEKESKDTAALSASQVKGDLYNAAQVYRGRSADRLLNAITSQAAVLSERLCDLETTLETLEEAESRMRLMEYPDLVKLRETIMSDARVKLGNALTAPVGGR
ncbi:MAG TPA: hypothetical protein PL176_08575 [Kiritimatiellia bacterium]|nr:MAG: hypothetical protein BWX70_02635 [Verrucomicrobia bacterium ADurb.Bin070]HPO38049.1 hypothetical protein [Kiritimatiellia bacterium]